MATVVIYNNDVQGALRALKKELQKEGVFRLIKGKKNFKNTRLIKKERMEEIVRRKIKDTHEKKANNAYRGVSVQSPKPFVFKKDGYIFKVHNDGKVGVYTEKNKKINEMMLDKVDFDDMNSLLDVKNKNTENQEQSL